MPTIERPKINEGRAENGINAQRNQYVVKANDLIQQSRYIMPVAQSKMLLLMISKIKPLDEIGETYWISILEFCKICNLECDSGKNYSVAKKAIKALADQSIWVKQPNGNEVLLRWLDRVEFDKASTGFKITFNRDMLPYLYDLRTRYTRYCLDNVLTMDSKYGIRLYELLKSYQFMGNKITFSVEELRTRMNITAYERYPDFRRFVLETAVNDINECSDIAVSYEPHSKDARGTVDYITFTVKEPDYVDTRVRDIRKSRRLTADGKEIRKKQRDMLSSNGDTHHKA